MRLRGRNGFPVDRTVGCSEGEALGRLLGRPLSSWPGEVLDADGPFVGEAEELSPEDAEDPLDDAVSASLASLVAVASLQPTRVPAHRSSTTGRARVRPIVPP